MLFKVNQEPLIIPPRYQSLFDTIVLRQYPRVNIIAPTQDGKSLTIGAAVTLVSAITCEKYIILAPSDKKADIIMSYVRDFATQNPIIASQLELDKTDTLDRLRRERSRKHLTFKRGGGVMTLTLDAKNSRRSLEAALGFGGKNIVADEAGLVSDQLFATVMRMLGGYDYNESFLLKIGNPFFRNHFFKSANNPSYHRINLSADDSLKDRAAGFHGFDPIFLAEMRDEAFYDVFYECKFPKDDEIDLDGYRPLVTFEDLKFGEVEAIGRPRLGCDIGGGGDFNVYVVRYDNYAYVAGFNRTNDTMVNVVEIEKLMDDLCIKAEDVSVDDIGIGRGVSDRLKERGRKVNGVAVGAKSKFPLKYQNLKAELYWDTRGWLKAGNLLQANKSWEQLTWIRYGVNSDKLTKIQPKDELIKKRGKSPDFAEALMLTFFKRPFVGLERL